MKEFGFQWHITDKCNLRCIHCYQDIYSDENQQHLNLLKEFADKIFGTSELRGISVNITGGEPLLYPHIVEFLTYISGFNSIGEINIITNGTFVNQGLIDFIRENRKIKYIKLSLESTHPYINNMIRGKENFETVTENISKFKLTRKKILIMTTLASYNFRGIADMVRYVEENRISGIIFERFVPLGRGRKIKDKFLKSYEWKSAVAEILNVAGLALTPEDVIQYKAFWFKNIGGKLSLKGALCNLGSSSMALMPDGSVFPCRRYAKKIADLRYEDFASVLKKLAYYEKAKIKARLKGEKCAFCGVDECVGCRALTYAIMGDENGDDFQCYL